MRILKKSFLNVLFFDSAHANRETTESVLLEAMPNGLKTLGHLEKKIFLKNEIDASATNAPVSFELN
jgi:hypothetical protein